MTRCTQPTVGKNSFEKNAALQKLQKRPFETLERTVEVPRISKATRLLIEREEQGSWETKEKKKQQNGEEQP